MHLRRISQRSARLWIPALIALPFATMAASQATGPVMPADFLIRGGTVYAGGDGAAGVADVVIKGDRIVAVGPNAGLAYRARQTVEARGQVVAPGFIDAHAHPESYVRAKSARARLNAPWLFQGATTLLTGVDGAGTPDIAEDQARIQQARIGTNLAVYVGFGAVRERVLGQSARAPTPAELDSMRALVAKGMCEGALGLSTGLFYTPQSYARTDEVIALAHEAALRGGLYDTHQRDESSYGIGLLASVQEVIGIGRAAALPVHIAHIKALGVDVQGKAPEVIAAIEAARKEGIDVTADQYPWDASGSALEPALVPAWAMEGGRRELLARLKDPSDRARIEVAMRENLRRRGGAESLLLTSTGQPWTGRTLAATAQRWRMDPIEAALRIIRDSTGGSDVASFNMREDDIRSFMREPWVVTSSDGSDGHPRQYATFPRKYATYVRDGHVITLEEFIRGSTGRTADMFHLDGRGYLRVGYYADVLVMDPTTYAPRADYLHPRRLSAGVVELFVNGQLTIHHRRLTGAAPGRILLHHPPAGSCPPARVLQ